MQKYLKIVKHHRELPATSAWHLIPPSTEATIEVAGNSKTHNHLEQTTQVSLKDLMHIPVLAECTAIRPRSKAAAMPRVQRRHTMTKESEYAYEEYSVSENFQVQPFSSSLKALHRTHTCGRSIFDTRERHLPISCEP
jgi:hypothetical protein